MPAPETQLQVSRIEQMIRENMTPYVGASVQTNNVTIDRENNTIRADVNIQMQQPMEYITVTLNTNPNPGRLDDTTNERQLDPHL
jgi:hypothetical protein